ncbi:MAG TPA: hypothetical protein P5193_00610 [Microthrixaceae bacterium]|nr:hypothetical protein [Microthrixaceae bacterium]
MGDARADGQSIRQRDAGGVHQPRRVGPGRGGRHLLCQEDPHRGLGTVDAAHGPQPGMGSNARGQGGIRRQHRVRGHGVRVEVEQPATAGHRRGQVPQVLETDLGGHVIAARGERDDRGTALERQGTTEGDHVRVVGVAHRLLQARDRLSCQPSEQLRRGERRPHGQAEHHPVDLGRPGPSGADPQLSGSQVVDLADSRVELPHAREASREADLGEGQVRGLDQGPSGAGALGPCEGQRTGADLGAHQPLHLPGAVAEPTRQSLDPVAVHHAIRDQPHRPGDDIGSGIPLGRPG